MSPSHGQGTSVWPGAKGAPIVFDPVEKRWKQMDTTALTLCFQDTIARARRRKQFVVKETVSLSQKIAQFADRLRLGEITALRSLMAPLAERPEIVVTFLASLELARLKKLRVYQEISYEAIYVELIESLRGFSSSLATGFDSLNSTPVIESPAHA